MCNCVGMARTFEETKNGAFPAANHSPACEDFKQWRYIKLSNDDGQSFIDTPQNVEDFLASDEGSWQQEDVYLTVDQFENLPEFQG